MAEQLKEYHSSFTGQEVDELLTKVKDGSVTADIEKELAEKADKSGYYPQLHVGLSDNLPDRGDVTEGLIGFRESAGADNSIEDGVANVQELLGNSVVWNQILKKREGTWTINGITIISNSDGSVTLNGTATAESWIAFTQSNTTDIVSGHKWLYTGCPSGGSESTYCLWDGSGRIQDVGNGGIAVINDTIVSPRILVRKDYTCTNLVFKPRLIDLTKMFQAGKEPSTIEEFNAIKNQLVGVDFNAYNEGGVLGVNIKGIKSVNDNAFNGEYAKVLGGREYCADGTITSMGFTKEIGGATEAIVLDSENKFTPSENGYVYASGTDICIHLVHTGYKDHVYAEHEVSESSFDLTPYFPNGMHGINGVRDSATPKKATRRFGVAKMKDLNFMLNNERFVARIPTILTGGGAICNKYVYTQESTAAADKTISTNLYYGYNRLAVKDSAYSDVASFVASLTDEDILIYELATPIETEIDPQLNMNYKVWDFGTEELLTDSKSAPVLARTIYGFNATDTIRGNKAKNEEQDVRLQTLESEVVRVGDYQPDLSVGVADQLAGQDEPTASEINFRKSGGGAILDGNARIEAIKGNSVVWNQHVDTSNFTTLVSNGVHFEKQADGGIKVYTDEGGATANTICGYFPRKQGFLGHYCAILGCPQGGSSTSYYVNDGSEGFEDVGGGRIRQKTSNNSVVTIGVKQGTIISTPIVFYPQFIDFTQMFGAGNEPTTIEEFYARKPIVEDEYAYNEGEVIHMDVQSIESQGVNAWDEEWELGTLNSTGVPTPNDTRIRSKNFTKVIPNETYYFHGTFGYGIYFYDADKNYVTTLYVNNNKLQIPSNAMYLKFNFPADYGTIYKGDYCINFFDVSINGKYFPHVKRMQSLDIIRKYFPDGMKSAGSAHDEIRYNKASGKWEKVVRIGSVDMGTLNWTRESFGFCVPADQVRAINMAFTGVMQPSNCLCNRYFPAPSYNLDALDKVMRMPIKNAYDEAFTIKDTSYTDVDTFKASLQGVMLYYELAEPIVTELDKEDQLRNFDYQVWNCGTEQAIANVPSTPLKADIVYGFNAYGVIKQLKEQMATLMTQMAQMQTAMASVTSNNNN